MVVPIDLNCALAVQSDDEDEAVCWLERFHSFEEGCVSLGV